MLEVAAGLSCLIAGVDPVNPNGKCLGFDAKTGKIGYVEQGGGAVGAMGNMIGMLYTPPAHTRDYVVNLAQNFGIIKSAQARIIIDGCPPDCESPPTGTANSGSGFQSILPLVKVWEAFRNIVYLLFVLVFIVIGVAIMLRVRIDPRTVMTIQNQIPKIIAGLILVTFSFAIAGFLIDLMWVAIYLVYGVFQGIEGVDVTSFNPSHMVGVSPLGAVGGLGGIGDIALHGAGAINGIITNLLDNPIGNIFGKVLGTVIGYGAGKGIGGIIGGAIGFGVGTFAGGGPWGGAGGMALGAQIGSMVGKIAGGMLGLGLGGSNILGLLGSIIAFLIISIALLWALIRVWFILLMAYIMILIDIVFAPFWILAGLLPGSKLSFNSWLRDIVANLAAFPAVLVMLLLGKTFIDIFAQKTPGQFVPPFIGNPGDVKLFGALIGLGVILTIPNVVKMMKTALNAPQIDLSTIGQSVTAGTSVVGAPITTARDTFRQAAVFQTGEWLRNRLFGPRRP